MYRQRLGRLRLGQCHARLRQRALGFAQFHPRVEPGGHAPARDVENVGALRLGALGNVREFIAAVEIDVRLHHRSREQQARLFDIDACGLGQRAALAHLVLAQAPQIQVPGQRHAQVAQPHGLAAADRLRKALRDLQPRFPAAEFDL